jgi:TPR repeat protein
MRLAFLICVAACGSSAPPPARPAKASTATACIADVIPPLAKAPKSGKMCEGDDACVQACDAGERLACTALAWNSQKVEGPFSETAARYFQRACQLGDPVACTNFAAGLATRAEATNADLACAVRVYRLTCAVDEPWGCGMLGSALASGKGVAADREASARLLAEKCTSIGGFACFVPATLLEKAGDKRRAAEHYQRACATGMDGACADAERLRDRSWGN